MWVLGIELRLTGLVVCAFTHHLTGPEMCVKHTASKDQPLETLALWEGVGVPVADIVNKQQ